MCWFVYIVRCRDNSLYTGITKDVARRIKEHNSSDKLGAKYTKARRPVELVYQETADSRSEASKREYKLRKLTKTQKEGLLTSINPV